MKFATGTDSVSRIAALNETKVHRRVRDVKGSILISTSQFTAHLHQLCYHVVHHVYGIKTSRRVRTMATSTGNTYTFGGMAFVHNDGLHAGRLANDCVIRF